jgi:hypothetical protein
MESEFAYWWIDAICINQHDLEELSQQVSIMINIYSASSYVTVWIEAEPWVAQCTLASIETMRHILLDKFGEPLTLVHRCHT